MGWETEFVLEVPDLTKNPQVLLDIVAAMLDSTAFSFDSMLVYKQDLYELNHGSFDKAIVAAFESSVFSPLSTLKTWLNQFNQTGTLIELNFRVKRLFVSEELEAAYIVKLNFDNHFYARPGRPPIQLAYEADTAKMYSIVNPERQKVNLRILHQELEVFMQAGVKTIRGLHGYQESSDIRTHILVYHQYIAGFAGDLKEIEADCPNLEQLSMNELLLITSATENYAAKQIGDGLFVWSTRGTDGRLFEFYQALLAWCKKQ